MAKQRARPLSHDEQTGFVHHHLAGRFQAIDFHLKRSPRVYGDLAAAAIFARALCGFLGLRVSRDGKLVKGRTYFEHAGNQSWEVKITDLAGGQFLRVEDLSAHERSTLEKGLRETNVAFAHLTFWTDPTKQSADGGATDDSVRAQIATIEEFVRLAVRLCRNQLNQVGAA
jgi:hypothetical protein